MGPTEASTVVRGSTLLRHQPPSIVVTDGCSNVMSDSVAGFVAVSGRAGTSWDAKSSLGGFDWRLSVRNH